MVTLYCCVLDENCFTYAIEARPAFCVVAVLVHCSSQKASTVVAPLLSPQAIELLENCLSSKEKEVWKALGPNWNMTKYVELKLV